MVVSSKSHEAGVVQPLTLETRLPWPEPPQGTIAVEAVPPAEKPAPQPLARLLMPLIMVVAVGAMIGFMVLRGGAFNPMMMLFPIMMLASLGAMFSGSSAGDPNETRRTYLRHLDQVKTTAWMHATQQRDYLRYRFPAARDLWSLIDSPRLWERNSSDPDVGWVRLAVGTVALDTPLEMTDSGAPEDLDPACAVAAAHIMNTSATVDDCPVGVMLTDFPVLRIDGEERFDIARSLVAQLCFHHGPDTIRIDHIGPGWEWLKWLPHARTPDEEADDDTVPPRRVLIYSGPDSSGTIDFDIYDTIIDIASPERSHLWHAARDDGIMLITLNQPATTTSSQLNPGCVTIGKKTSPLARTGSAQPQTGAATAAAWTLTDDHSPLVLHIGVVTATGVEILGRADRLSLRQAGEFARQLTGYSRPVISRGSQQRGLLALCGIPHPGALQPATLWPPRDNRRRLAVPIGLSWAGQPVVLDIKESAQGGVGPHGLCIGATGSGKSELLRTLVVALAVTHSPDDVNFVLVDFKGGATFLGLDGLPHTSAVITNLAEEADLVARMQDAITGEMTRRQEVLRNAGNFKNVDDYEKARRAGQDLPPLPALLIVLDEFSELLGQHPDFADLFTAVGRLGRSLHIHLLLASQRLEEGRLRGLDSHLSYRLGLKTFSAAESRQVLGVVDAYHLPAQPGAGILRKDADELVGFQASYVSGKAAAELPATGEADVELPHPILLTDPDALAHAVVARTHATTGVDASFQQSLVDLVVDVTSRAAHARHMSAHAVWLPPLPARLPLGSLVGDRTTPPAGELSCVWGMVDRPAVQRQDPYVVQLTGGAGHVAVAGMSRSGTSTALRSLVVSLALTHPAPGTKFYIVDYSHRSLAGLAQLPHVAGVACAKQEEKVRRVIDEVLDLVDDPQPQQHTFLVIDGWQGLAAEMADTDVLDKLTRIATEGLGAQVHLVIAVQRWTLLKPSIKDAIGLKVELKLNDPMDSMIDRQAQKNVPESPGRGIEPGGHQLLFAHTSDDDIAHVAAIAAARGDTPVTPLKMLPARAYACDYDPVAPPAIALAIGGPAMSLACFDTRVEDHLLCCGSRGSGKTSVISTVAGQIACFNRDDARLVVLDPRRAHLGEFPQDMVARYAATPDDITQAVAQAATTLKTRLPAPTVTPAELKARSWWTGPEIYLIVDDYDLLPDGALTPLVTLIPHSRDIGLHLIITRKSGGMGRALWDPVLSAVKDQTPTVVLLDCDKDEGKLFGIRPRSFPPGRATIARDGETCGVYQLLLPAQENHEQPPEHNQQPPTPPETRQKLPDQQEQPEQAEQCEWQSHSAQPTGQPAEHQAGHNAEQEAPNQRDDSGLPAKPDTVQQQQLGDRPEETRPRVRGRHRAPDEPQPPATTSDDSDEKKAVTS